MPDSFNKIKMGSNIDTEGYHTMGIEGADIGFMDWPIFHCIVTNVYCREDNPITLITLQVLQK